MAPLSTPVANSSKFLSTSTPDIIWRCIESGRDPGIFERDLWATGHFLAKDLLEVPLDIMEMDTAEPCAKAILEEWNVIKHACTPVLLQIDSMRLTDQITLRLALSQRRAGRSMERAKCVTLYPIVLRSRERLIAYLL